MMTTLEFKRAEVAERGMAPAAVVESFDVFEHCAPGVGPGLPPAWVNQFDFERSEETLRHRVVPAVAAAAHAAPDPVQRQQLLVVVAGGPGAGWRSLGAAVGAPSARPRSSRWLSAQPTTRRENRSRITARYNQPSRVHR